MGVEFNIGIIQEKSFKNLLLRTIWPEMFVFVGTC